MIKYLERIIHSKETIEHYLPQIIEAFVSYYGESKRKIIEYKFNNIILTCIQTPASLENNLNNLKCAKSRELIIKIMEKFNIESSEKNIKLIFGNANPILDFPKLININKYYQCKNASIYVKKSIMKSILPALKLFYHDISEENLDEYLNKDLIIINNFHKELQIILKEYKVFVDSLIDYTDYLKSSKTLKKKIENKYILKLIEMYKELFNQNDIEYFAKTGRLTGTLSIYIGYNLETTSIIEAFSEESEKIINDKNSKQWQISSIINDRIAFFKSFGIDLGDNYQEYINDQKCLNIIPKPDLIKSIRDTKEEFEMLMYNEYYASLPTYQAQQDEINKLNLYNKDNGFNIGTYMYKGTYVTPNLLIKNGQVLLYPLININFDNPNEFIDKNIIHEFNHIYELMLNDFDDKSIHYTCGWDHLEDNLEPENEIFPLLKSSNNRQYELFNEIINEMIAQEITEIFHKQGNYMFVSEEEAKVIGGTGYEDTKFLVQDFYNEFKDAILASRNGNINILYEACGKENFESLNELFHLFKQRWPGLASINLYQKIENNVDDEEVREFKKIVKKKEIILHAMIKYKQNKERVL